MPTSEEITKFERASDSLSFFQTEFVARGGDPEVALSHVKNIFSVMREVALLRDQLDRFARSLMTGSEPNLVGIALQQQIRDIQSYAFEESKIE